MTRDEAVAALRTVDELLKRALAIVSGPPSQAYVDDDDGRFAFINIEGLTATLRWPAVEDYETGIIREQHREFPADLLFLDDTAFLAWKFKAKAAAEHAEWKRLKAAAAAETERFEREQRALYEQLKAKYEESGA